MYRMLEENPMYLPVHLDLQGVDARWHASDGNFAEMFAQKVKEELEFRYPDLHTWFARQADINDMDRVARLITQLANQSPQKLVLLIDEVDASSNHDAFLRFLAMLRQKYLRQLEERDRTFHSVVLAGVHDIKSLKL